MLAVTAYPQAHVDACRARIDRQVARWRDLKAAAGGGGPEVDAFETELFGDLVLVLDQCFVHRQRGLEGKDGNPLNEVRLLCAGILGDGRMGAEKSIKVKPEHTVLGLAVGDEIAIREADFVRLADAFFAEIERRFT